MNLDLFRNISSSKPKELAIPYMGSKRKYAYELISKMLEYKPQAKYFYDICGGGGAMTFTASQMGLKVFYNDLQTNMVEFIKYIYNAENKSTYGRFPDEFYQFITREKFFELLKQDELYSQFARIVYSFGNMQKTYMFGKDIEHYKHLAHNIVMFQCKASLDEFNEINNTKLVISDKPTWNERRLDFRQAIFKHYKEIKLDSELEQLASLQQLTRLQQLESIPTSFKRGDIEQLERLQQLKRIQQLERLEQLESITRVDNIEFSNKDYRDIIITTPFEETIVYIDPPYRGTGAYIESLNYDELDNWFRELPCIGFMSEYTAPFEAIHKINTYSGLSPIGNTKSIEKLFINRQ